MHPEPAPADRERDEDPAAGVPEPAEYEPAAWEPVVTRPDPMSEEDQQALLDAVTDDGEPWPPASGPSTPIPKQIHWIVTKPGHQPIPVSSASTYRIVAAGPVTDVRHVR